MSSQTVKTLTTIGLFLFLLFVAIGDKVLPEPMKTTSYQTRTSINKFLIGLIPNWNPKNPNERTEDAIEKQQQGQPASP
jgi:hypothetical protein